MRCWYSQAACWRCAAHNSRELLRRLLRGIELAQVLGQPIFIGDKKGLAQHGQAHRRRHARWPDAVSGSAKASTTALRRLLRRLVALRAQRAGPAQPALARRGGIQSSGGLIQTGEFGKRDRQSAAPRRRRHPAASARVNSMRLSSADRRAFSVWNRPWSRTTASKVGLARAAAPAAPGRSAATPAHGPARRLPAIRSAAAARVAAAPPAARCAARRQTSCERCGSAPGAARQNRLVQPGQASQLRLRELRVGRHRHAAADQFAAPARASPAAEKLLQPAVQPLAHLAGGALGEGDGQDFMRRNAPACRRPARRRAARARCATPASRSCRRRRRPPPPRCAAGRRRSHRNALRATGLAVVFVGGRRHGISHRSALPLAASRPGPEVLAAQAARGAVVARGSGAQRR